MNYYKDTNNNVYGYSKEQLAHPTIVEKLKKLTPITEAEMRELTKPKPSTPEQLEEIEFQKWKEQKLREEFKAYKRKK